MAQQANGIRGGIKAWFQGRGGEGRPRATRRRDARPALESLERREVLTTVQGFEALLSSAITTTVKQFVRDAATVEVYHPTLASSYIDPMLIQLNNDNNNGQVLQEFTDLQSIGKDMFAEAVVATVYKLPASTALAAYNAIETDLTNLAAVKTVTVAFLDYVATHSQYHAAAPTTTTTQMATGLFSAGTIGGNTQAVLGQEYQNSLTHYAKTTVASYNQYFNSLSGQITAGAQFDQEAQTGDYPGQDLSDED